MKVLCWILVLAVSACQEHKQTSENAPAAVRDLLIDRSFWTKKTVAQAGDSITNIHRFTITNTSHRYAYRHIEVRFDYYDRDHHKIDSAVRIVEKTVEPRAAIMIGNFETNMAKEATATATATIVNASAEESVGS